MKKLIVAIAMLAVAVCANAASIKWSCTGVGTTGTIYGGSSAKLTSTANEYTAYLFDATTVSQASLLAGIRNDGKGLTDFTSIANSGVNASSKIAASTISYGEAGTAYTFYFAIMKDDSVFISQGVNATALAVGDTTVSFASGMATASQNLATFDTAYSGASWYSTTAVPEPTSGLLMLLGMAGLALRHRRA